MPEDKNKNTSASCSVSVVGVIQIVFIILKLTDNKVISTWPWWKVFLPLIVSSSLGLFLCCCGVFCICIGASCSPIEKNDKVVVYHPQPEFIKTNEVIDTDVENGV
jgi:hypothetical protein